MRYFTSVVRVAIIALGSLAAGLVCASESTLEHGLRAKPECVRLYYDRSPDSSYHWGEFYAQQLQNLLGHFPQFKQIIQPIENYRAGQIEECRATIYLGTYFDNRLPSAFLDDFSSTSKQVAWIGYSVWQLGNPRLEALFGHRYVGLSELDTQNKDEEGNPTFFKEFTYRGETFRKFGEYSPHQGGFAAAYELVKLRKTEDRAEVLSEAIHNGTGERAPYVLRASNRFYVADMPFSYTHEADRYLIVADLLFDILDVPTVWTEKKPAVFRIEDVSSYTCQSCLLKLGQMLSAEQVPFHIALIPIFADPFLTTGLTPASGLLPMNQDPTFLSTIQTLKGQGAKFIWHGVTHQYAHKRNPESGISGDDYEFWDTSRGAPIREDSSDYLLRLLDRGWDALTASGLAPKIWEVPHYMASPLDYHIFARVFSWNIGRVLYSSYQAKNVPVVPESLWYEKSGLQGSGLRRNAFKNMSVSGTAPVLGQFFPYEIYGDTFGQRFFPENLGNPTACDNLTCTPRTIDDLIDVARRNRVLRDAWASFYFHPYLLEGNNPAIQPEEIERLVRTIRELGYEFVDLEAVIERLGRTRQPAPEKNI